ncbi:Multidrug efflux pump subunit AcrB [Shimia gijangensis]|uniref:Multidrug efflux pump subunit AcrB n=1 Tax=Shimia gijangensis TaxID=1470563 RepID=A0A1M6HIG8_9RHOB|nr:efflux RND transporter permease subunit [Shimia gijangensis]SHJ21932.1 Multidrug efflux pump subunit AcrB [Shimia gijangensis]
MSIAEFSIKNRLIAGVVIVLSLIGGWQAYKNMPRFEDPEFVIRTAQVITSYPGATPLEVANEVTETLESAFQEMIEVEEIRSKSEAGRSTISVDILYEFSPSKEDLSLIYTKLRNKAKDAARGLPPGASDPYVNDDYANVYGLYYVLTSDGFSPREMQDYAKAVRTELLAVDGVAKVAIDGVQDEAIYLEFNQTQMSVTGVSLDQVFSQIQQHTSVVSAGDVVIGQQRVQFQLPEIGDSVTALMNTVVTTDDTDRIVRLRDIADVVRSYQDPPSKIMRYNGRPAVIVGISALPGENIVKVGEAISKVIEDTEVNRPLGIEIETFYHQGEIVDISVKDFAKNVGAALLIVLITLGVFMGMRSAVVIGGVLLLTIAATLAVMNLAGIPMHRISLGALIIALGMLVDNAIVVTEGILVGVKEGKRKLEMSIDVVARTKWPLLGGTLVGIIAFAPIGFAPGSTAEYTGDLFWVVMISLGFSWLFALTAVPLFADILFKEEDSVTGPKPDGAMMRNYKKFMHVLLKLRWGVIGVSFGALALAIAGMAYIKPGFFPSSTTPQVVVDVFFPEGTDIYLTDQRMADLEQEVSALDGVSDVHTLIGGGTLRYMLVYSPEDPTAAYGQLLVKVDDYKRIDTLIPELQAHVDENYPNAQSKVWRFQLGPGGGSKIEALFTGRDPVVLRQLADQAQAIMAAHPGTISIKDDWRQQVPTIEPLVNETRARRLGVTREDIANAMNINFSGSQVALYREADYLIPIIQRTPRNERVGLSAIETVQVSSPVTGGTIPLLQLVDGFDTVWRDSLFRRVDRVWAIQAQCDPAEGILAGILLNELRPQIEAIELPPGYKLKWEGEYGDSTEANEDLASTLPVGLGAMVLTVIFLFNALRQPLVIFLTVPLAMIGVTVGLVSTGTPMEFMAILGVLSLSGLLIKNAIVLVDQMDLEIGEGKPRFDAVVDSAASRVRPVMMGSLTTVLGVVPLFLDAFFKSMAVVLVFGLTFATVLTLLVVPALYMVIFRIRMSETASG